VRCVCNSLPGFDLQFYLLLFVVSSSVVYGVVFPCTQCNVDNGVCVVARVLLGSLDLLVVTCGVQNWTPQVTMSKST
jgi:hypothetical protein